MSVGGSFNHPLDNSLLKLNPSLDINSSINRIKKDCSNDIKTQKRGRLEFETQKQKERWDMKNVNSLPKWANNTNNTAKDCDKRQTFKHMFDKRNLSMNDFNHQIDNIINYYKNNSNLFFPSNQVKSANTDSSWRNKIIKSWNKSGEQLSKSRGCNGEVRSVNEVQPFNIYDKEKDCAPATQTWLSLNNKLILLIRSNITKSSAINIACLLSWLGLLYWLIKARMREIDDIIYQLRKNPYVLALEFIWGIALCYHLYVWKKQVILLKFAREDFENLKKMFKEDRVTSVNQSLFIKHNSLKHNVSEPDYIENILPAVNTLIQKEATFVIDIISENKTLFWKIEK